MQNPGFTRFVEYAPGKEYANTQLPVLFENIYEKTGIRSRHIAGPDDTVESIGVSAGKALFDTLNITAKDCGGLVLSSCNGNEVVEHQISKYARSIAQQLGLHKDLPVVGVNFACSGFPAAVKEALTLAKNSDRHILIISAEIMSALVDWQEMATAALFADRATATSILPGGHAILDADAWEVDDPKQLIHLEKIDAAMDIRGQTQPRVCIRMNGQPLYKAAPSAMVSLAKDSMQRLSLGPADIGALVPHQANGRFMQKITEILQKEDAAAWSHLWVVDEIERRGNVGSASIPGALSSVQDSLPVGKVVLCPTVGAAPDFCPGKQTEGILAFRVSEKSST